MSSSPRVHGPAVGRDVDLWMRRVWAGGSPSVGPVHSRPTCNTEMGPACSGAGLEGEATPGCVTAEWPLERQGGVLTWCEGGVCRGRRAKRTDGLADWQIGRLADGRRADGMNGRGRRNCIQAELELDLIAAASPGGHGCAGRRGGRARGPPVSPRLSGGRIQCGARRRDRGAGEEEHGWVDRGRSDPA